jgi:hypothetical protein
MNLHKLCKTADYVEKNGMLFNKDCIELMDTMLSNERERERERDNAYAHRYSLQFC